ncbi:MAG: hypothetical protein AB1810_09720 [Pseudomonadota bacterium]
MTEYSEQIQKTYRVTETEELLDRIKAGSLTEEAHALALEEIRARGISITDLPIQPSPPLTNDKHPEPEAFWEQTRKKGKWSFVLWRGVILWGLPLFVFVTFVVVGGLNQIAGFIRKRASTLSLG